MTLHAFDPTTNKSMKWVAVPLEFVDWMAANFRGIFIQHLQEVDPYDSVLIPEEVMIDAVNELTQVREKIRSEPNSGVPKTVDLYGSYGISGGSETARQMIEFFQFVSNSRCKVVSVGD